MWNGYVGGVRFQCDSANYRCQYTCTIPTELRLLLPMYIRGMIRCVAGSRTADRIEIRRYVTTELYHVIKLPRIMDIGHSSIFTDTDIVII